MSNAARWWKRIAKLSILASILCLATTTRLLSAPAAGTALEQSARPDKAAWYSFASFADSFDRTNPLIAVSIVGWTPNCTIWPAYVYCAVNGEHLLGPPISEFGFNLPIDFLIASRKPAPLKPPYPKLATSVLYNGEAKEVFSQCKSGMAGQTANPCVSAQAIHEPLELVRAMWEEVDASSSTILYIQKDFDQCNPDSNWTTACANMRHSVDMKTTTRCNMDDYPWQSKAVAVGCFPRILVTAKNRNLFQFPAGSATVGDTMILLAFHIMQIGPSRDAHSEWQESTFWWQAKPSDSSLGTGCPKDEPCSRLRASWQHFQGLTAVLPKSVKALIPPAYNPYIEAPTGAERKISCVICHSFAGYPTKEAGEEQGTGLSTSISRASLAQKLQGYLATYHVTPSSEVWSLAFGIESRPATTSSSGARKAVRPNH